MSAFDRFANYAPSWSTPPVGRVAVTPSDSVNLPFVTTALDITTGGTLAVRCTDGNDVTFTAVSGQRIPGQFIRVFATGTTATGILAVK